MKEYYSTPRTEAAEKLRPLLIPRGCRISAKDVVLLALDIWVDQPKLSFPDSLAAAYSMGRGHHLAAFDEALSRTPGIIPYVFG